MGVSLRLSRRDWGGGDPSPKLPVVPRNPNTAPGEDLGIYRDSFTSVHLLDLKSGALIGTVLRGRTPSDPPRGTQYDDSEPYGDRVFAALQDPRVAATQGIASDTLDSEPVQFRYLSITPTAPGTVAAAVTLAPDALASSRVRSLRNNLLHLSLRGLGIVIDCSDLSSATSSGALQELPATIQRLAAMRGTDIPVMNAEGVTADDFSHMPRVRMVQNMDEALKVLKGA